MHDPARKPFSFTLSVDDASTLDATLNYTQYTYPDMTLEDCLVAIVQVGQAEMLHRLNQSAMHRSEKLRITREKNNG